MSTPPESTTADPPPPPLWRNRDYMLLWSGQLVSTLGNSVSAISIPLLILALTGSPENAGFTAALYTLPYLLFSLPAGAWIDRWDRKRVMIVCDLMRGIVMASVPLALLFNTLTIWQLYLVAFVEGTLFVFFNIAEVAALPRVVSKEQIPHAAAQNQATFATAGLVGPGLGGFLFQTVGRAVPFVIDAVSFTLSMLTLLFIRTPFQAERKTTRRNLRAEIAEGWRWVWQQPVIRFMAFITGGLNFLHGANTLIVIIVAKHLGAGEAIIGVLASVGAIGGIGGALLAGRIQQRFGFGPTVIAVVWLHALLFPLYTLAPSLWVLGAVLLVLQITLPIYNVTQVSYRLALVPDGLQGRVNSAVRLIHYGFSPLGAAVAGVLLGRFGIEATVLVFGLWLLGLGLAVVLYPPVRQTRQVGAESV